MGCSNTKLPIGAVADTAGANVLSMVNSMEPPQAVLETGDKIVHQTSDALAQASQVLENASEAIANSNPFNDASDAIAEMKAEATEAIESLKENLTGDEEKEVDENEATANFVAVCPPKPSEDEVIEEAEENEEKEDNPSDEAKEDDDEKEENEEENDTEDKEDGNNEEGGDEKEEEEEEKEEEEKEENDEET